MAVVDVYSACKQRVEFIIWRETQTHSLKIDTNLWNMFWKGVVVQFHSKSQGFNGESDSIF